jgi:hypothetical protein
MSRRDRRRDILLNDIERQDFLRTLAQPFRNRTMLWVDPALRALCRRDKLWDQGTWAKWPRVLEPLRAIFEAVFRL